MLDGDIRIITQGIFLLITKRRHESQKVIKNQNLRWANALPNLTDDQPRQIKQQERQQRQGLLRDNQFEEDSVQESLYGENQGDG